MLIYQDKGFVKCGGEYFDHKQRVKDGKTILGALYNSISR
jgi:hypothetical protein